MSVDSEPGPRAFEARLLSSLERLQRFVVRRHGAVLADDLVQETLLRAWSGRAGFDESQDLWPWLKAVAGNAAARRFERDGRFSLENLEVELIQGRPLGGAELDAGHGSEETQAILGRLHGDEREVVDRFYLHGEPVAEIARDRQCPEGTVKSQLSRARKKLALLLGGAGLVALAALPWRNSPEEPVAVLHSHTISVKIERPAAPRLLRRERAASEPQWTVSNGRFVDSIASLESHSPGATR